jgi:hypothetical protein
LRFSRKITLPALLSTAILVFNAIPANSANPPKSGAQCAKVGLTKTYQGKKYTCLKSGKKLVWNKGTLIQKKIAAPVPRPTLSTSPSPSAIPSPNPSMSPSALPSPAASVSPNPSPSPSPSNRFNEGDSCEKVGERITNALGYLECREIAKKAKKFFQLSSNPKAPPTNVSPESIDICRIPDQSTTDRSWGPSIAYPIPSGKQFARIPRMGQINALIIPIDFADTPGKTSPSEQSNEIITKSNEWMKWYSQGKSFYKFQTYDRWIRAPRNSSNYVPDTNTQNPPANASGAITENKRDKFKIASEYLDLAENYFDFKGAHTIFFLYPKEVKIWSEFWGLGVDNKERGWKTTDDPRLVDVWIHSSSYRQNFYNFPVWAFFLHENLHNQGLQGHAPNQGSNFGIMTNQFGLSLPLTSWDTLVIDWQIENQFYCLQKENLKPTTLVMSPMEREEFGTKAVMIKLSKSQVLVIESRRQDKWSSGHKGFPGMPDGFYGVIVYKVDTTATPQYGVVEPDGPEWQDSSTAYAYLIRNLDVDHGYINGAPQSGRIDMNFVIYEGESLITNGIRVSLMKSGDHDEIKIERV